MCNIETHKKIQHNLGNAILAIKGLALKLKNQFITKDERLCLIDKILTEVERIDTARNKCIEAGSGKMAPKYERHEEVKALKIRDVRYLTTEGGAILYPEDLAFASFKVDVDFIIDYNPRPGGYYVEDIDSNTSFVREAEFKKMYNKV